MSRNTNYLNKINRTNSDYLNNETYYTQYGGDIVSEGIFQSSQQLTDKGGSKFVKDYIDHYRYDHKNYEFEYDDENLIKKLEKRKLSEGVHFIDSYQGEILNWTVKELIKLKKDMKQLKLLIDPEPSETETHDASQMKELVKKTEKSKKISFDGDDNKKSMALAVLISNFLLGKDQPTIDFGS